MAELLPCPGCGRNVGAPHDDEGDGIYFVDCAHCGWRGPRAYNLTDAWNRWQRRAAASTSTEGAADPPYKQLPLDEQVAFLEDCLATTRAWCGVWKRKATSTEGAEVKAAADQLLAALQRYGFPVSDAAVRPLMDGGSLEAQAVHVAAMQLRAKLNPPAPKVTTDEAEERE